MKMTTFELRHNSNNIHVTNLPKDKVGLPPGESLLFEFMSQFTQPRRSLNSQNCDK